jgi:hypothetical protein
MKLSPAAADEYYYFMILRLSLVFILITFIAALAIEIFSFH